eukprot:TRINITY_DN13222_c0_g1_i3.p4 TRINITY_DN13222_c0_g1~~TRINITY_DN13222_c0_g1_i3.p4  ORF type:complete len:116 (+),score=13.72 TRINITY_DN13222_c0_g1_i3:468-815(+)
MEISVMIDLILRLNKTEQCGEEGDKISLMFGLINSITYLCFLKSLKKITNQIHTIMKDFLKFTLATVVGIILSSIVIFFIGAIILFGTIASSDSEVKVKANSCLLYTSPSPRDQA